MKFFFIVLSFLMVTTTSLAQDCEYETYYALFECAAKNYSEKNYIEAEKNIKRALETVAFPLGEGLHLALLIAQKREDPEWAKLIAVQLAKGGVPLRYFRYLRKYEWFEKFETDFKVYSDYYKEHFNAQVKEQLLSVIQKDKEFNKNYHDWRTRKIELTEEELILGASQILSDFKKITDQHGFPTEQVTGYHYVPRTDRIAYFHTDALMIHMYQRGVLLFKDELQNIVCSGGLHPNYKKILKNTQGLGNSTGVEQEMKIRYEKYRGPQ